ncbi:MAG TPA: hypothetical protein VGD88_07145 [Opitutaceae bacterium]
MILRSILILAVTAVGLCSSGRAQSTTLGERTAGGRYRPPSGVYSVAIPVLPELGGQVDETEFVVTFRDAFTMHASIACFPMDATQRWENETRGRRDYLIWFFTNFVQGDFQQRFPGAAVESARFIPSVQDGALLTYMLLPGGTMFVERLAMASGEAPPVAKRGNLLFVRGGHIYVLSIELAEKVLERRTFNKTVAEEDAMLEARLSDLLAKMEFTPAKP